MSGTTFVTCGDCPKTFKRNDHLKRHFESIHSQIKYPCSFCGEKISRKDHLKRHMRNMKADTLLKLLSGVEVHPTLQDSQCRESTAGESQNAQPIKVKEEPPSQQQPQLQHNPAQQQQQPLLQQHQIPPHPIHLQQHHLHSSFLGIHRG